MSVPSKLVIESAHIPVAQQVLLVPSSSTESNTSQGVIPPPMPTQIGVSESII